jgi:hypothetical protein
MAAAALARRAIGARSWVVGYPKCGNTWFGIMLRKALTLAYRLDDAKLRRVLSDWRPSRLLTGVPAIGVTHHMPRFNVENYREMTLDVSAFRGRKVVLLIRDPRDMLVSLYMHNVYRETTPLYDGEIDSIVYSEVYGIEKFLKYYGIWYRERALLGGLLLVRYEDLWHDTEAVLREALTFLGVPGVSDALVREAVAYGGFENMRQLEVTNALRLVTLEPSPHRRDEAFQVRKGIIGDHVNHLSPEAIGHVDRRVEADLPAFFGYGRRARR